MSKGKWKQHNLIYSEIIKHLETNRFLTTNQLVKKLSKKITAPTLLYYLFELKNKNMVYLREIENKNKIRIWEIKIGNKNKNKGEDIETNKIKSN